jgi:hypothetical protein
MGLTALIVCIMVYSNTSWQRMDGLMVNALLNVVETLMCEPAVTGMLVG